jgi:hypothetical protein
MTTLRYPVAASLSVVSLLKSSIDRNKCWPNTGEACTLCADGLRDAQKALRQDVSAAKESKNKTAQQRAESTLSSIDHLLESCKEGKAWSDLFDSLFKITRTKVHEYKAEKIKAAKQGKPWPLWGNRCWISS